MAKKKIQINKYLKEFCNYKDDTQEYKNHKEYFGSYAEFCDKNKLIRVSRAKFLNHLKKTIDKNIAQQFMNMMWEGKKLGECKEHFELTLDEVDLILKASIVNHSFYGKEVRI